jgi:hypothetical protein
MIRFNGAKRYVRPQGVLLDSEIDPIARDLEAGRITGLIGQYQWYRQATPFCPLDSATLCPCDREPCGADAFA